MPYSTRKVDCLVANAVTGLGTTVTKIASDLRHLAFMKEVGEPREAGQIGSSAMVSHILFQLRFWGLSLKIC
jgi:adenylosuccinate lyase